MVSHMKTVSIFLILFVLSGCVTTNQIATQNSLNLLKIEKGMPKDDVLKIMKTEPMLTYVPHYQYRPEEKRNEIIYWSIQEPIPNPYRTEKKQIGQRELEILYYYTQVKKADNEITDDELTPIVLEHGKVIGWGWDFLKKAIEGLD